MLLYYISNHRAFRGTESEQRRALLAKIAEAAAAEVDYIQLREKDLTVRDLERLAREVIRAVRNASSATRVLINQHTEVALAYGADGVHLPGGSLPASEVRALWMRASTRKPVIGVSAHTVEEIRAAEAHGADFAVLAPIFEKPGTRLAGLGLAGLAKACGRAMPPDNTEAAPTSHFPVLALGGVNLTNALECLRAGAAGVAGIRLFQERDVKETVGRLRAMASTVSCR
jgi:thiamine-phosphate pyrophosphorylase